MESFYHLRDKAGVQFCQGTACFAARHLNYERWKKALAQEGRVYCLGKCYAAPAASTDRARPDVGIHSPVSVVLSNLVDGKVRALESYVRKSGYRALEKALSHPPEKNVEAVETSGLRGRGGAGFPTGRKWRAVYDQSAPEKFVVANADEGDPGAYIDRMLLEDDPHKIIEGLIIAGYAVGARKGYIYVRSEYPDALDSLNSAIAEARSRGILGQRVLDHQFVFDVEVIVGRGSYVCGEETALIRSIEGKRPEVMPRPPYPTEHGLFGNPTLVNNVETLASIPWIVSNGGEAYRSLGFSTSRGTKVISLNSLFWRPGLYEIEFGISLKRIVQEIGGGLKEGSLKALLIGGPLAGILPPEHLDAPFGFDELRSFGASVGHGGIVAFNENTSILELLHHVFSFAAYESCGKCTPCRLGSSEAEKMFAATLRGARVSSENKDELSDIVSALGTTSLCGLGTGVAEFAQSAFRYFGTELESCFR